MLRVIIMLIGFGFLAFGVWELFKTEERSPEIQRQLFGMIGVGLLFLLGGAAMGKR